MQTCPEICEFKTFGNWCGLSACIRRNTTTQIKANSVVVVPDGYVKVVRCRDCKYYHGVNEECGCNGGYHSKDWFCADGERRDDDADDRR